MKKRKNLLVVVIILIAAFASLSAFAVSSTARIDVDDTGAWGSFKTMSGTVYINATINVASTRGFEAICSHNVAGVSVKDIVLNMYVTGDTHSANNSRSVNSDLFRAIADPFGANCSGSKGVVTVSN